MLEVVITWMSSELGQHVFIIERNGRIKIGQLITGGIVPTRN